MSDRPSVAAPSRLTPGRALLVVLSVWAMLMIAPDFYRVFTSLGS